MALTNLHILDQSTFERLRLLIISQLEQSGHNSPTVYLDTDHLPTIGVGFNLMDTTVRSRVYGAMQLTNAQRISCDTAFSTNGSNLAALQGALDIAIGRPFQMTNGEIMEVFNQTATEKQTTADNRSGITTPSLERIVMCSLAWGNADLIGPGLIAGLENADSAEGRAEAWYQIRYLGTKGVSFAFFLEPPCHVAHALS